MKTKHRPILTEEQQALLDGMHVRLVAPAEQETYDGLIVAGHYLHG
jgi:hypothetical protein